MWASDQFSQFGVGGRYFHHVEGRRSFAECNNGAGAMTILALRVGSADVLPIQKCVFLAAYLVSCMSITTIVVDVIVMIGYAAFAQQTALWIKGLP